MSHYGYLRLFVNGVSATLIKGHNNLTKTDQKAFNLSLLKRIEFLRLTGWAFLSTTRLHRNSPFNAEYLSQHWLDLKSRCHRWRPG